MLRNAEYVFLKLALWEYPSEHCATFSVFERGKPFLHSEALLNIRWMYSELNFYLLELVLPQSGR